MKTILILLIINICSALANEKFLVAWSHNPEPEVLGYTVYTSEFDGVFNKQNSIDVGHKNYAELDVPVNGQTVYIAVAAYVAGGIEGEMGYAFYPPNPPLPPTGVRLGNFSINSANIRWGIGAVNTVGYKIFKSATYNEISPLTGQSILRDSYSETISVSGRENQTILLDNFINGWKYSIQVKTVTNQSESLYSPPLEFYWYDGPSYLEDYKKERISDTIENLVIHKKPASSPQVLIISLKMGDMDWAKISEQKFVVSETLMNKDFILIASGTDGQATMAPATKTYKIEVVDVLPPKGLHLKTYDKSSVRASLSWVNSIDSRLRTIPGKTEVTNLDSGQTVITMGEPNEIIGLPDGQYRANAYSAVASSEPVWSLASDPIIFTINNGEVIKVEPLISLFESKNGGPAEFIIQCAPVFDNLWAKKPQIREIWTSNDLLTWQLYSSEPFSYSERFTDYLTSQHVRKFYKFVFRSE